MPPMSQRGRNGGWPSLADSKRLRFAVLSALYFAQGVPWGFVGVGLTVYLTGLGLDKTAIGGVAGLAMVPWSFKLLWGPILDRVAWTRFGRRRPFIFLSQLLMGLSVLALILLDPLQHLAWMSAILFVHNTFASVQDVATDGLAIDVLKEDERGKANAFMSGSKSVGAALGGGAGLILASRLGWAVLFVAIAATIFTVMMLVGWIHEGPKDALAKPTARERFAFRVLWRSFASWAAVAALGIALVLTIGYGLVGVVWFAQLRGDLGINPEVIGLLTGTVDLAASVTGALLGGLLADRLGARRVMAGAMALMALLLATWGLAGPIWTWIPFLAAWSFAVSFVYFALSAAALGFFMGISNPAIGATHFAVYMATMNLAAAGAAPSGGALADAYGIPTTFLVAAAVQLAAIAVLPLGNPAEARRRF